MAGGWAIGEEHQEIPGGRKDLKKGLLITIDGPAGAGKSTVSRLLANKLSYTYLDTGALYRALAYRCIQEGLSATDEGGIANLCQRTGIVLQNEEGFLKVLADGEDVTDKIRTESISLQASAISAMPPVRAALLSIQREAGKAGGVVAEGRDMGTIVFPEADFKFFLEAGMNERIKRRHRELVIRGDAVQYQNVKKDLMMRDRQDREREIAPLKVPEGAFIVDSTHVSAEGVVETILSVIRKRQAFL
jgi:cytidylate kinase